MAETFKTLKTELLWRTIKQTRNQAEIAARHVDDFYTPTRQHSALEYLSRAVRETGRMI